MLSWCRGFALLSATTTGRTMIGCALTGSTGVALVLNRKANVGASRSVASGAGLALAGVGAIAYFGHRLVRAGENLAAQAGFAPAAETES